MPIRGIPQVTPGRTRRRAVLAAITLPALAGLLATAAAPAQASAAPARTAGSAKTSVVSGTVGLSPQAAAMATGTGVGARQQALAAYWTPARMKAAIPDSQLPSMQRAAAGKPSTTAQNKPQGPAVRVAPATGKVVQQGSGISPQYYAYYANLPVGSPAAVTNGKVYGTYYINGSYINYQCSAAIVNSEGKSTVWTAGHCVTEAGTFAVNWAFVPNCYNNGSGGCVAPYGVWYAKQLWTTSAYFGNNNDLANDVGAAIMYPQYGYEIVNYFGGQGIEWNYGIGQYMSAFGYPVPGFTGVDLVRADDYTYNYGGGTVYMFNNMTGGSSGGPWLAAFNGSYGNIDGHNDFRYNAYPNYMWSPYYGNQVASLYGSVRYLVG
jgi:hypothetical protein